MPSKLCWFQNQSCSCWPRSAQDFAVLLRLFFWWFQNSTVDEGCSSFYKRMLSLEFPKGLEWWLIMFFFEWAFTSYNQVISCKQFIDFFLDRWEMFVLHPSTINSDSCLALFEFIEWWLIMFCLNEVIQITPRLLSDDWWCLIWMRLYKLQPGL